jgi:hypothetical protein
MVTTTTEPKKLKIEWTDEEMDAFNRNVGEVFTKIGDNNKMRYCPVSTFPQNSSESGGFEPGNLDKFIPRYNVEMFTWKDGKNPGGDNPKVVSAAKQPKGSFFIDCELFLKNYKPE